MASFEPIDTPISLQDYEAIPGLSPALAELRNEAEQTAQHFAGRRLCLLSGDDARGALVENIPRQVALLRACGLHTEWLRVSTKPGQTQLHRRLHNLILGDSRSNTVLDEKDSQQFAEAANDSASALAPLLRRDDILMCHGVGTAGIGAALKAQLGLNILWRNVGGLDDRTPATRSAWSFLKPHLTAYDRGLFTCAQYIPQYFTNRAWLLPPSVDPLSTRNRELSLHQIIAILTAAGVLPTHPQVLHEPFAAPVLRLNQKGQWRRPEDMELLYRPMVTQISQWDYLDGLLPLMQGFAALRQGPESRRISEMGEHQRQSLQRARLVLLTPDREFAKKDSSQGEGYQELVEAYRQLDPEVAQDICLLSLPRQNSDQQQAQLVNALQRLSSIVVQNAVAEGFGLGLTEAAYKRIPVLAGATSGARLQIRHKIDGYLCQLPEDPRTVAKSIVRLFADEEGRRKRAVSAQRRVLGEFLIISELRKILRLLSELL